MFSNFRKKDFTLHIDTNEVAIGGETFKLTPKEMGVLELLIDRSGTTVKRTELLEKVWGERFANDQGLTQAISRLRNIFSKSHVSIRTIPKKGYQLQIHQVEQNSAINWMKTNYRLIAAMFVGLIIVLLFLTDQINIRVSKDVIDKDQNPQSSSMIK